MRSEHSQSEYKKNWQNYVKVKVRVQKLFLIFPTTPSPLSKVDTFVNCCEKRLHDGGGELPEF